MQDGLDSPHLAVVAQVPKLMQAYSAHFYAILAFGLAILQPLGMP